MGQHRTRLLGQSDVQVTRWIHHSLNESSRESVLVLSPWRITQKMLCSTLVRRNCCAEPKGPRECTQISRADFTLLQTRNSAPARAKPDFRARSTADIGVGRVTNATWDRVELYKEIWWQAFLDCANPRQTEPCICHTLFSWARMAGNWRGCPGVLQHPWPAAHATDLLAFKCDIHLRLAFSLADS